MRQDLAHHCCGTMQPRALRRDDEGLLDQIRVREHGAERLLAAAGGVAQAEFGVRDVPAAIGVVVACASGRFPVFDDSRRA